MPLIGPATARRANTAAYFVFALILFAIGLGFVWAGRVSAPGDDAAAKVFASDPSCSASLSRDLPSGACKTFDAVVLGTETRYHGIGKTRAHDDIVSVRLSDGSIHERDMYGSEGGLFVYAVKSGDSARVQRFRGDIVRIVADGLTVETMSAPDVSATADAQMPWGGAGLIVVALIFAAFGVRAARRPSAVSVALLVACWATSAVAAAPFGYLDTSWQTQLKSLGIPVVIPRTLPPGFRLAHFKGKSFPARVAGKNVTGATYELDFQSGTKREIILFVSDQIYDNSGEVRDPRRAPFSALSPGAGPLRFMPVRDQIGPGWLSVTVRIDRPRGAHPTYLSVEGDADEASFRQFAASLVRFAH